MKHLITGGASLLALAAATSALGAPPPLPPLPPVATQTTSDITQTGDDNEATVAQDGGINTSDVVQVGDDNVVDVNQNGDGNFSNIRQGDPNSSPAEANAASVAVVIQEGDDNVSDIVQIDRDDTVSTAGSTVGDADLFIRARDGNPTFQGDPEAFVSQDGNANRSYVDQFNANLSRNLIATVSQTNDTNISDIGQEARGNSLNGGLTGFTGTFRADVEQMGNSTSFITQFGENPGARGLTANVTQTDSTSTVDQRAFANTAGSTPFLFADIDQTGLSESTVTQTVEAGALGSGDFDAIVNQSNGATSTITQTALSAATGATGMVADVLQNGDSSSAITQQFSAPGLTDLLAEVVQTGDGNTSTIFQDGSNLIAYVDQIGTGNTSLVDQDNDATSDGNTANVDQLGDDGNSTVTQTGSTNTANLLQGLGTTLNVSTITQGGSNNLANVFQTNSGNFSGVTQTGTGGALTVTQGPPPPIP